MIDQPCRACRGQGPSVQEQTLTVSIPRGVEEGMVLRVPGRGLPSPEAGGVPGDLLIVVRSAPDPRFRRAGADLWRTEAVPVVDAVLGASREVPTLDGPVVVAIPPGTQPGTVMRLPARGLPRFGGKGRGDLYLQLQVALPERLEPAERALWERLRGLARAEGRRPA